MKNTSKKASGPDDWYPPLPTKRGFWEIAGDGIAMALAMMPVALLAIVVAVVLWLLVHVTITFWHESAPVRHQYVVYQRDRQNPTAIKCWKFTGEVTENGASINHPLEIDTGITSMKVDPIDGTIAVARWDDDRDGLLIRQDDEVPCVELP
jgi:membrane-associated protease RseP (regulator of RpoE activity)